MKVLTRTEVEAWKSHAEGSYLSESTLTLDSRDTDDATLQNILKDLQDLRKDINEQYADIKHELKKVESRMEEAEGRIEENETML